MKLRSVFILAIAFLITVPGICEFTFADPTWTTIAVPGADLTEIWAIDGSNLVGRYYSEGDYHGFLYDGSNFSTIDVPGGTNIGVYGIDGGNVVGSYYTDEGGDPVIHGFLYDGTNYATVDFPGADDTEIRGITGSTLVGVYAFGSGWHGFSYDGSNWATIDAPGALDTYIRDIDGSNLVGYYLNGSYYPGFLYDGTNWTNIDGPGAYGTRVSGIDGSNLVGSYSVAGTWHGFLYDGTDLTTIDAPGASNTYIRDIDGSNIVGHYGGHGFIYTIPDTTAPTVGSISANPNVLRPPNHKMVEVSVEVIAEDNVDPAPFCYIVDVTANEPVNGPGDGNTELDWEYTDDPLTVLLRAEVSGDGDGRIYTIHVICEDASGNVTTANVDVTVPHDKSKGNKK